MKWNAKVRVLLACFGFAAIFTLFSARLIQLQVGQHDKYAALAARNHGKVIPTYGRRGLIEDVRGEILAGNEPFRDVIADGSKIKDPQAIEAILARHLGSGPEKYLQNVSSKTLYVSIKKNVPVEIANAIEADLKNPPPAPALPPPAKPPGKPSPIKGIYTEEKSVRTYPNGTMLAHILGFMNSEGHGVQGIERTMDDQLRGQDGFRFTEKDANDQELVAFRGQERPPRDGANVRLTVDMGLQNIVETQLADACQKWNPVSATAIMMRPSTGEILALANWPTFNPATPGMGAPEAMKNGAIINMFEPGSTFKIVTAAAALNEKVVEHDTMIFCENGAFNFGGHILHDHEPSGNMTVDDILMKSSNIGAAKMALMLGDQRFYEYIRRFGFGERTGINLPGEIPGLLSPPRKWDKITGTRVAMGQSVDATPLQVVTAMSVIANGGRLMLPQIVHDITDDRGQVLTSYPPVVVRQVITPETAAIVRDALIRVVSKTGTADNAQVDGFTVAGKTGTAQKPLEHGGGYDHSKYVVSFVGFMPAEAPEFACFVMLDEARNAKPEENYGGKIAAPVFREIATRAASLMNLQPRHPVILTKSGR